MAEPPAGEALHDADRRYRSYVEFAPVAVFVADRMGRYVDVNQAAQRLLGYTADELLHLSIPDVIAPDDLPRGLAHFTRVVESGAAVGDFRFLRKGGAIVQVTVNAIKVDDERFIAFCEDVTEQTRMEAALRESESVYRAVVESAADGFWMTDLDGRILAVNDAYVRRSGYSRDELLTMRIADLEARESEMDSARHMERLLRAGSDLFESEHRAKNGSAWPVEVNASYWPICGGRCFVFVRDLQRRARSEALLRVRLQLSEMAQSSPMDDVMQTALDAAEQLTDSQIGFFHFVDDDQEHLLLQAWSTNTVKHMCSAEGKGAHYPISDAGVWVDCFHARKAIVNNDYPALPHRKGMPDGHAHVARELVVPVLRNGLVTAIIGVGNKRSEYTDEDVDTAEALASITYDIVARKRAEADVQRVVSASPAVVYHRRIEPDRIKLTWISDNLHRMTGYTVHDAMQAGWWYERIHEQDRPKVMEADRDFESDPQPALVFRLKHVDGRDIWMRDERRVLRDAQGKPVEIVGSWSDVTRLVELEAQLRQAQKLEAVGQLAGGVAHDFNNLLTVITGYSEILLNLVPAGDKAREYVADIRAAGERASALTRQLLAFSRKQVLEPRVLDVNNALGDVEKMLRRLIGEHIVLTVVKAPGIGMVRVDPGQLEQVIVNLAVNARDAMPGGGRLTFESAEVTLDDAASAARPGTRPGRYVQLSVTDTGCGMSREVQARVFEPFFTTKETGKGTGLGLATVFGIVSQSDGAIDVTSTVGVGSTFRVWLPVVQAAPDVVAPGAERQGKTGNETILLVEDDDTVRRIAAVALKTFGYQVLTADCATSALDVARRHPAAIHLMLTDVIMPGMDGEALADAMHGVRAGLPVLFMSGYVDNPSLRARIGARGAHLLQKPFTPQELTRRVREVLDGKSA
jgi:PAS domain S-box-containing protein